jgi:competence protein ComFC
LAHAGVFQLAREIVFPSICRQCGKIADPGIPLCPLCLQAVEVIKSRCDICGEAFAPSSLDHVCGDCLEERPIFQKAAAWAKFSGPAADAVQRFKYQRAFFYLDWMVAGMAEVYKREFAGENFDMIIPVPLHWVRLMKRGYNQALVLARPLARKLKAPIQAGALSRAINNPPQVGLSRFQRKENMKKVFAVKNPGRVKGKKILLIDDVITTGATMDAAAKALLKSGAGQVSALAFARA